MRSYTADDARRRMGALLKEADASPVEITRHGRRQRYVLMSAQVFEIYEAIREAHARDRCIATVESAVGKLLNGEQERGFQLLRLGNALMGRWLSATGEKL